MPTTEGREPAFRDTRRSLRGAQGGVIRGWISPAAIRSRQVRRSLCNPPFMSTSDATEEMLERGFAVVDDAVPGAIADGLRGDAERYAFEPPGTNGGGRFAMGSTANEAPRRFVEWVEREFRIPSMDPNELSYQHYEGGSASLRVHRDQRYYGVCIVIATLRGSAVFGVHHSEPPRQAVAEWETRPRQVVLLRGWTPVIPDPRPFHRVDAPPAQDRLMVQLRMNLLAVEPEPRDVRELTEREIEQGKLTAAFPETVRLPRQRS